jgi:hypothetical protein
MASSSNALHSDQPPSDTPGVPAISALAPHDADMVIFSVRLPKALRRELRRFVAEHDMTMQDLVTEAIRERLAR